MKIILPKYLSINPTDEIVSKFLFCAGGQSSFEIRFKGFSFALKFAVAIFMQSVH